MEREYGRKPLDAPEIEIDSEAGRNAVREAADITSAVAMRSKAALERGMELGLIDQREGSLPELLNTLLQNTALALEENRAVTEKNEEIEGLLIELTDFAEFFNSPRTQDALPFYGVEVFRNETGEINLFFSV